MAAVMYTNFEPYLSNISNTTDNQLISLIQQTSIATHYIPATLIMAVIFIIILVALKIRQTPTTTAVVAASFAHMILCVLIYPLGILSSIHFYISLAIPPFAVFMLWLENR